MDRPEFPGPAAGANQQGLRDHNERLILSLLQRQGPMPGTDVARVAGLSPQTVSVILRGLEQHGFVTRGDPQRGRVGKPAVPIGLAANGALSIGLKIGRRSADLILADFLGHIRWMDQTTYPWPEPAPILSFLRGGLQRLRATLSPDEQGRLTGIGIAMPWQIWNWHDVFGAPEAALSQWKGFDISRAVAEFSPLPVFIENDATAAARAEHVYGRGREFRDFAYFFVGSFIGGGLILNHSVYEGRFGNAGAFGPLPAFDPQGRPCTLLDVASVYRLEAALVQDGQDPALLWRQPQDWSGLGPVLDDWIATSAREMARAALTVAAVIDMEAVLIDGAFPPAVRHALVQEVAAAMSGLDTRGIIVPRIEAGLVGPNARALGAACGPIAAQYLLNTHALLGVA